MERFIPFEKLSKKKQREFTAQKRGTWGGMNPVTRKAENPKAYDRKKVRKWSDDSITVSSFSVGMAASKTMTKYIALLRGINMGGNNKITMQELKAV